MLDGFGDGLGLLRLDEPLDALNIGPLKGVVGVPRDEPTDGKV
jgi:hypothetical protein